MTCNCKDKCMTENYTVPTFFTIIIMISNKQMGWSIMYCEMVWKICQLSKSANCSALPSQASQISQDLLPSCLHSVFCVDYGGGFFFSPYFCFHSFTYEFKHTIITQEVFLYQQQFLQQYFFPENCTHVK